MKQFVVKNWVIEVNPSGKSGWLVGPTHVTGWIKRTDGGFAFDNPKCVPQYVKERLAKLV